MTKQLMKLTIPQNGTWKIVMNDAERFNRFCVYYESAGHRRLLEKYGDMASCLHFITQQLTGHEWRMTDQKVERIWR